jgi:hypothetical protein
MDPEIKKFVVHELAAATFVPYHADGSVNYAGVDAHARDLAVHGVLVAFINGTTGDSMILREEERKLLAEAWVAAGKKYGVRILNHIGAQGLQESCELARHAQAVGGGSSLPVLGKDCARNLACALPQPGAGGGAAAAAAAAAALCAHLAAGAAGAPGGRPAPAGGQCPRRRGCRGRCGSGPLPAAGVHHATSG